jgi:GNAT superfamily N-acetyltransferase
MSRAEPDRGDAGGVTVRPMRGAEAAAVGRLTLRAYDAYGRIEGPYRDHLADPAHRLEGADAVLVALLDGAPVGNVTFVLPGDPEWEGRPEPAGDAGFRVLAVEPAQEGRGVARALVEACLDRARRVGARRLVVTSMSWMTRAHRLYERLGFVHRPDLDVRFPSGVGHTYTIDLDEDAAAHFPPPGPAPEVPPLAEEVWRREPPA